MPTRRFDGPDLDSALARARSEVGSGARVLSAERVRSGGLGGFFAKERVEIEVEIGDEFAEPVIEDDDPDPTPGTLLDLVDLVSRAEHQEARTAIRPDRVEAVRHLSMDQEHLERPLPPPPPPTVSTETSTFAEILERITAQTAAPAPDPMPVPAPATTLEPAAPIASPAAPDRAPVAVALPRAPMRLISAPAPSSVPPLPAPSSEPGPLTRLGLPPELEPCGDDLREALLDQLATLPRPPALPATRGTVVAIVGPRGLAHHVARTVCDRVGADPSSITTLSASRRRTSDPELTTAQEVTDNRRAWRRRPLPTVAVIDSALGNPTAWVAEVLGALEPTAVWGVVEASRKVEDILAWSNDLGGLDALCLTGLDETVSPASPLRTGVPVALLEGQPATPDRWADLLLARLAS